MHTDACAILGGEPRQRKIVEVDEAIQQLASGIDLHRQARFGEIDLHLEGAFLETATDLLLVLA